MIRRLLGLLKKVLWLLPGFLLFVSFPPMGRMLDVFFALAPLLWYARRHSPRASAKMFFANGLLFWVATLSWMPAIIKNGGPWPLVVLGWGALSAYCAMFFAAFGWLSSIVWRWVDEDGATGRAYTKRLFAILFAEPVLWAGIELLRSRLFGGFAWNQLGVAAVNAGFGSPAAIGGVYLVSAAIILVNGTMASIVERMMRRGTAGEVPRALRTLETILPLALVFAMYSAAGGFRPNASNGASSPSEHLKVAMMQRNFPPPFQPPGPNPQKVYAGLADRAAPWRPDLVVLPESAFVEFGDFGGSNTYAFAQWLLRRTGADAVLGGGCRSSDGRLYNSAALYLRDAAAKDMQVYDKVHLVPFGEFIPGDELFPALKNLAPVGSCTPGELKVLDFRGVKLGPAICFEDTDSAQMRRLAQMGAQVLVFVTNDSWFANSCEAMQHAWQAVARAVETGLPIVRVGNSGVTGIVEPSGAAKWLTDPSGRPLVDAEGEMCENIGVKRDSSSNTVYVAVGDVPLACAFLLLILALCVVKYWKHHEQRRQMPM